MVTVVGLTDVATQIILFVVTSSLVGLAFGVLIGRATLRRWRRGIDPSHPIVQERVLVQPDVALFAENERLRDRLVAARARIVQLESTRPIAAPLVASNEVATGPVTTTTSSTTGTGKSRGRKASPGGSTDTGAGATPATNPVDVGATLRMTHRGRGPVKRGRRRTRA